MKFDSPRIRNIFVLGFVVMNTVVLSDGHDRYKILMLVPFSPRSHRSLFVALAGGLTLRGHQVSMLSSYNPADHNPNVTYIKHGMSDLTYDGVDFFNKASSLGPVFKIFEEKHREAAQKFYDDPKVKELYDSRTKFDLAFVDQMFAEEAYAFLDDLPFITISTSILDPTHSAMMGNLLNPAYVPNMVQEFPRPYSFLDRLKNLFLTVYVPYMFWAHIEVPVQEMMSKRFPELPPIHEIKKNQSMTFINSHYSFSTPLPLLPNQIEIGGIHIRDPKPLPQELVEFMEGSTSVVYMSLGSIAKSSQIPHETFEMFLSAFKKLPYKFLWKFERQLSDVPKNVLLWEWFPQQDVIGSSKVKVFISHGGLLGVEEAIYHGTPMLLLPLMGDQPKNAAILHNAGAGINLFWSQLTEEIIMETIQELMNNSSYRENIARMSSIFRDQKETPLERAIFWTEYVVRNQGAANLRSPEHSLSWVQILHLDLVLMVCAVVFITLRLMRKIGYMFLARIFVPNKPKKE